MKIIGLTGGSGAGKSTAALGFKALGCPIIDADEICRGIYEGQCLQMVVDEFGEGVLTENGELDRAALGKIVFADREKLDKLNGIVHHFIKIKMNEQTEQARAEGAAAVVLDAPQLFEADMQGQCDATVAVLAPTDDRIYRICNRDGIDEQTARERISMQYDDEFFSENCDYTIDNPRGKDLSEDIKRIYKLITED